MGHGGDGVSGTTEWLSAAGGIIGAIGGPAGLWAAWNQNRENRRRREAEPEELITLLGTIRSDAVTVTMGYKDEAWFEASGLDDVIKRFDEVAHLVRDDFLRDRLGMVSSHYDSMRHSLTYSFQTEEERYSAVMRQSQESRATQELCA